MRTNNYQHSAGARTLHTPVLRRLPEKILRLMAAIYAAYGSPERMTLNEWHDVEEELKPKLENKYHEHQQ